jgi:hypothetical protein
MTTGVVVACPCGEVYELRPEYAGRLLECPVCGRHLRAGGAPGAGHRAIPDLDPAFDRDVFLLRERLLSITAKYEVWAQDGTPVLYVERPTYPLRTLLAWALAVLTSMVTLAWTAHLAAAVGALGPFVVLGGWGVTLVLFFVVAMSARPLRHVTVYRDESRAEVLLRVRQDQRLAFLVRSYTVLTPAGQPLARLVKHYGHNVVRKRWYVESPAGTRYAMAIEDSIVLSLLRRVLGSLFGVLRTNFILVHLAGASEGAVFGEFNRKFTLLERYVLDLSGDPEHLVDRRVALALGVMLDTGERR